MLKDERKLRAVSALNSEGTGMKRNGIYFKWGLTAFCTVCAILLVYDTFFAAGASFAGRLMVILAPVLYGAFIAYLLAPVVDFFERTLLEPITQRIPFKGRGRGLLCRTVSLLLTFLAVFILFYVLLSILLPELYKSVVQLVNNAESYYNTIYHWINDLLEKNPDVEAWVTAQLDTSYQSLLSWLSSKVVPQVQTLLSAAAGGVMEVLNFLKDMVVGLIVSVYLLATKERCAASCRRLLYSLMAEDRARWTLRGIAKIDSIFSGFVRGKLLDSLIIGILCFVCSSLLRFPYTPLVSVVVGVTNIIPFFGPIIGAVPCVMILIIVDPWAALRFGILVLALQQFDGNILGPKILGDSTGLSAIWVLVSIVVCGGLFGFPGMLLGVPTFAVLYSLVQEWVNLRLRRKGIDGEGRPLPDQPSQPPEE